MDEDDVVGAFKVESRMLGIDLVEAYRTFSVIQLCYKAQMLILFFNFFAKLLEVVIELWQLLPKVFQCSFKIFVWNKQMFFNIVLADIITAFASKDNEFAYYIDS